MCHLIFAISIFSTELSIHLSITQNISKMINDFDLTLLFQIFLHLKEYLRLNKIVFANHLSK